MDSTTLAREARYALRWVYSTPFGREVVPEVKGIEITSSSFAHCAWRPAQPTSPCSTSYRRPSRMASLKGPHPWPSETSVS